MLVGGLEHDFFHSVGNVIIPTDELIVFRGVGQPPTRIYNYIYTSYTCIPIIPIYRWVHDHEGFLMSSWLCTSWLDLVKFCPASSQPLVLAGPKNVAMPIGLLSTKQYLMGWRQGWFYGDASVSPTIFVGQMRLTPSGMVLLQPEKDVKKIKAPMRCASQWDTHRIS